MILAQARSGSTFLREALNDQPEIVCHGEVFSRVWISRMEPQAGAEPAPAEEIRRIMPERDADPLRFLQDHIYAFPGQITGFKVIYEDFFHDGLSEILADHARTRGLRIYHLRRLNPVAALASRMRMARYQLSHSDAPGAQQDPNTVGKLKMEPAALARYTSWQNDLASRVDALFPDAMQIRYETLAQDFPRILADLGLPDRRAFGSALRKMTPQNLEDAIENYGDVAAYDHPAQPIWN
ncbi:hypothetical protein SAMN05421538_106192 [Paracoccus isoporae]|uniref:LPS sulfotransferase NodH n=2 Tax=Paracoccus isoporae TaxID=591205 RepID=A0A1G7CSE1_9RHOB|nr:hypothetical protein SAMN05421538_106192 [Paracoccus isoporae]